MLSFFEKQQGDKSEMLAEIRKVLPGWENKRLPADNHIRFVTGCLKFLAVAGEEKDKLIITGNKQFEEKFKEYKQFSSYNPMAIYFEMVQYELKEVRALIEAVKSKQ